MEINYYENVVVSFIIPIYNTNSIFLMKCINSIIKFRYRKEIILIDDGSTNKNTLETLRSYEKVSDEIKIFYKKNSGPAAARNVGLDIASGKYVVFVDADDRIDPDAYAELILLMEKFEIHILCHTYDVINEENIKVKNGNDTGEIFHFSSFFEIKNLRDINNQMPDFGPELIWGKIYRKKVIENIRFDESLYYCEDNIFNLSPEFQGINFLGVYRSAYIHLKNSESLCNKFNPDACNCFMKSALKMKEALSVYKEEIDWNEFYKTIIFHFYLSNILRLDIFNIQNSDNLLNKIKIANDILLKEPFRTALDRIDKRALSPRQKVVFMLLKMKLCWMAYIFFYFGR